MVTNRVRETIPYSSNIGGKAKGVIALLVYIDDIIVRENDKEERKILKQFS